MAKFEKKSGSGRDRAERPAGRRGGKPGFGAAKEEDSRKNDYKAKRSFTRNKSIRNSKTGTASEGRPYRPFDKDREKPHKNKFKKDNDKPFNDRPKRSFNDASPGKRFNAVDDKPFGEKPRKPFAGRDGDKKPSFSRHNDKSKTFDRDKRVKYGDFEEGRAFSGKPKFEGKRPEKSGKAPVKKQSNDDGLIRLNKYLSNAGVASRREADILIQSGTVKVNGVVVDQLGYKIKPGDKVTYGDAAVKSERKVYLLLNKPKDYITTVDDPQERKTVMELIKGACKERIYPVGRLDRNTTGLLLFTNDGELTTRLTHPKFGVKKIYHVSLNKGLKPDDFKAIIEGVELEDGMVVADDLAFVGEGKKEIGIEIHSGRNRIVRRLFEHLGYDVLKLDRVAFAGLTKKDLPRGKHRFLTAKEISFLHMIG